MGSVTYNEGAILAMLFWSNKLWMGGGALQRILQICKTNCLNSRVSQIQPFLHCDQSANLHLKIPEIRKST